MKQTKHQLNRTLIAANQAIERYSKAGNNEAVEEMQQIKKEVLEELFPEKEISAQIKNALALVRPGQRIQ